MMSSNQSRYSEDGSRSGSTSNRADAAAYTQGLTSEKPVMRSYTSTGVRRAYRNPWIILPWTVALVFICLVGYLDHQLRAQRGAVELPYSPANHMIQYENREFEFAFGENRTQYENEPSPELDSIWNDLFSMGIVAISQEEASQLYEKTQRLPHDPENRYIITMSVFHELHCINMLRKQLFPEYYTQFRIENRTKTQTDHLVHCIDSLRQSTLCHVDLATIPFQVVRRASEAWARERAVWDEWDLTYRPVNDPLDSDTWAPGWQP
ncbi:hypothetical protein PG989_001173 [Apiospora arundinis]